MKIASSIAAIQEMIYQSCSKTFADSDNLIYPQIGLADLNLSLMTRAYKIWFILYEISKRGQDYDHIRYEHAIEHKNESWSIRNDNQKKMMSIVPQRSIQ